MCRHVAYLGPAIPLSHVVFVGEHSLLQQAYAPRDMRRGGTINADGFGVGWYAGPRAVRYRRASSLWSDTDLAAIADTVASASIMAAVRSATVGMPVIETAAAPFTDGRRLFSMNGRVGGWPESVSTLTRQLPDATAASLEAPTDAALLWALVRQRLASQSPGRVIRGLVLETATLAPDSRLNLLLCDGENIVATSWWHSLWTLQQADSVTIASEPLNADPAWQEVPDRHIVTATASKLDISPLETP